MKLSEVTNESGLVEEMNRICGTTNSVYSKKSKIARLNESLDRYFSLAFASTKQGPFDDSNQSSAPIETQTLVSGTNSYKFSSFTSEVLGVLKLAVLNQSGTEVVLEHEVIDDADNFGELYKTTNTGTPRFWTRLGDFIYLRPTPVTGSITTTAGLRAYVERTSTKFNFTTCTVTIATPAVFSATAHGLVAGDTVIFETDGALPTGLTEDTVQYFVISAGLTTDAFEVSTTLGGSAVNTSGSQSGNHTFVKTSKIPGIPTVHHPYLARHASLPFLIEKSLPQMGDILGQITRDEDSIIEYFSNREKDIPTKLRTVYRNPR